MQPHEYPRVFVRTRGSVELESGARQLHCDWFDLRRTALRVAVDEPWPPGSTVALTFRVLDDPPVEGYGRVILDREPWTPVEGDPSITLRWGAHNQSSNRYMTIELRDLERLDGRRLGALGSALGSGSHLLADAARYALAELAGNAVRRELDHRLPGYRTPVLLLHGLLGTRGALSLLEERLKRDAFPVFSFRLGLVNVRQIAASAREVAAKVERLCEREGLEQIDAVGHSMGGLIGLRYIKFEGGGRRVRRFVSVGAPFSGSRWAYPGAVFTPLIPSASQLTPGSRILRELRERPLPPNLRLTCIAAKDDLLVSVDSAVLPGARNVLVPRGHAGLVTSQTIYPIVRDALS